MAISPPKQLELWLGRYVKAGTDHTLARNTLGLTAYLADPDYWAREGSYKMLRSFLDMLPDGYKEHLRALSTSTRDTWMAIDANDYDEVIRGLLPQGARHFFWMKLFNDVGAPSVGFHYIEHDPQRADRSAVLELTLPQEHPPGDLAQLALEIGNIGPIHSIIGGYAIRFDDRYRARAFNQVYRWASRYIALDIQVPEEMAWRTPDGLPGTNWLTVIGGPLAEKLGIDLEELRTREWPEGITALPADDDLLIRAGEAPVLGDLNRLRLPREYTDVACVLAPYLVKDPPELWGPFYSSEHSLPWFRRFLDVQTWAERDIDLDF